MISGTALEAICSILIEKTIPISSARFKPKIDPVFFVCSGVDFDRYEQTMYC